MRKLIALLVLIGASRAEAADLAVTVRTNAGAPVADAVVMLYPDGAAPSMAKSHFDWPMRVEQQNLQFSPFVLIVPVGATVAFPNLDRVRHHVYSFSPAHPFELKLYGNDETRTVRFDKPGPVALGCNIHDNMVAFIRVVDTPYAAKTDANGLAQLRDLPAGGASLHVWRPYLKAPNNEIARTVTLPRAGSATETVGVELHPPPPMQAMY
jgi:plastocyanin